MIDDYYQNFSCRRNNTLPWSLPSLSSVDPLGVREFMHYPWSSLVEGGEGLYLANCQTNLVIALYTLLSLLFWKLINTTAYHFGRYKSSSPVSYHAPCSNCLKSENCDSSVVDYLSLKVFLKITFCCFVKSQLLHFKANIIFSFIKVLIPA